MSEHLSPHERALLDALQRDDTPDVGAQRRVKQQLFAELGLGVASGALIAGAAATSHAAPASGIVATGATTQLTTQLATQLTTQGAANVATQGAAATGTGVAGTLGAASAATSTAGGLAALAAKLGTAKVVLGLTAALATAGGTALWSRVNAPEVSTAASVASAQTTHISPTLPPIVATEIPVVPLPEVKTATAPSRPRAASSRSTLEDEAQLLAQAQQKISQGDARGALTVLSEHQREFPRGTLSLERQATFAIARCLAGQTTRGRAEAVRFRRQHPNSPMVKRLESACQLSTP